MQLLVSEIKKKKRELIITKEKIQLKIEGKIKATQPNPFEELVEWCVDRNRLEDELDNLYAEYWLSEYLPG